MSDPSVVLVTGFEPFGEHRVNPSAELAKSVDGRRFGDAVARSAILPVQHAAARSRVGRLLDELDPGTVVHLGLAGARTRIALERVAVNVRDYAIADNTGYRARDEPCVAGGPPAYFATLAIRPILAALTAEGIPAYVSDTAGTYLCNETLYSTLHTIAETRRSTRAGFIHVPLLASMVAESGIDAPSMDFALMLRAVEIALRVVTAGGPDAAAGGPGAPQQG
jgi:pyroglutamyl-peptidase